jgi:hypothetical protein
LLPREELLDGFLKGHAQYDAQTRAFYNAYGLTLDKPLYWITRFHISADGGERVVHEQQDMVCELFRMRLLERLPDVWMMSARHRDLFTWALGLDHEPTRDMDDITAACAEAVSNALHLRLDVSVSGSETDAATLPARDMEASAALA